MNDIFLRKENGEYYAYLLGKNGEARPKVNLQIVLMHIYQIKTQKENKIVLTTDKEGKVKLGKLKKVIAAVVKCNLFSLEKNFMITGDQ